MNTLYHVKLDDEECCTLYDFEIASGDEDSAIKMASEYVVINYGAFGPFSGDSDFTVDVIGESDKDGVIVAEKIDTSTL
jgi:hypothetical protein